jgi:hypothetical protein
LYIDGDVLRIYESGTLIGSYGTAPASTDQYSVTYDGINVQYYQNGTLLRTVAGSFSGGRAYLGCAFAANSCNLTNLVFGPLGPSIGTGITGPTGYASANVLNINSSGLVTYNNYIRGTVTANGTTPVSVSNSLVQENSIIVLNRNSSTAVDTLPAFVNSITGGTGFTIVNTVADSSTYNYLIQ